MGKATHGTVHLPSSGRYCLTAQGISETADFLDFDTPSDFVRAYPMSREWLTLLIRRMDAVAGVYRLAASMSTRFGESVTLALRVKLTFQRPDLTWFIVRESVRDVCPRWD